MSIFSAFDRACMAQALQLARKGWYTTSPNPRVGCIIALDHQIVGRGFHYRAGEAHAEINALRDAGSQAQGATAYVTLEPCNHQGQTGPCVQALLAAGISEVVFGMTDPHPQASGGLEALRQAGVKVRGPLFEADAEALNQGFITRHKTGFPLVTVKLAMSLDGRTAMASGESQWITSELARRDVQKLRAGSDAVITGIGTVMMDNPSLNVRPELLDLPAVDDVIQQQPLRVVVDSELRLPANAKIVCAEGPVLIATTHTEPTDRFDAVTTVEILPCGNAGDPVDLTMLLKTLADKQCNEVLVEAGSELAGAFVEAGLVDKMIVYIAPKLMGSTAKPLLTIPLQAMADNIDLKITDIRAIGPDWRVTAIPERT